MKGMFWNIRGLANSPFKLALKRLITTHKSDIFFVVEPWMKYSSFSSFWLQRLGFKLFAMNNGNVA